MGLRCHSAPLDFRRRFLDSSFISLPQINDLLVVLMVIATRR
jgi:hypothetical protein